ncbi:MAG: isoleucine--tRNA ligase [Candidatus Altimarinota bacterium]
MAFKQVKNNQNLAELELEKLEFWKKNQTFKKSLENRQDAKKVVFFDGPPFANGLPHYGHLMISSVKDAVARYWTMRGFSVPRTAGWDCHGLPVENEIEKAHNMKGRADIEAIGVAKFNADCRASVFKYTAEWEHVMDRLARWVDFENGYATLNNDYMESIWWVFKQIWEKKLVYKGYKPMHISTALETPLSNFEVSLNYKDITDYSVTAKFELVDEPGTFILAWTTTPWTLPGNQALAIGAEIEYVKVAYEGQKLIVAKELLESVFKDKEYEVLESVDAKTLAGKKYKPLFDYYAGKDSPVANEKFFQILMGDFVTTESGTGIVHIAGGFGEDDYNLIKEQGMEPIIHVLMNGNFKDEVQDFAGKYVKGQDQNVAKWLEEKGLFFSGENYRHSYPHCWRTDTPLLNYVTDSWFIKVTDVKEKMLANNQKINWQPEHIKEGRFGKWLEGARDWSISRNRYWGCPIPIWQNENGDVMCLGSIDELKQLTGGKLPLDEKGELDLHKPFIDDITFMHPDHADSQDQKYLMKRVGDVFDCWFESGSMPYAQLHYPFENKDVFENNFPADFIVEAIDQTRGWFYTLHVLSTILFDKPAFNNIICTGHVNAADGEKLSKSKKNYPDPSLVFSTKGVDAMRFYLYQSPVVLGDGVRFSEQHVDEFLKKFNLTIWNTYSFFVTYANIDGWTAEKLVKDFAPKNALDKWILSELNTLIKTVDQEMEAYNLMKATRPMIDFVDNLSNWYIRRSRRRFWKSENDGDKNEAYQTLYTVLTIFSKLLAPYMPYLSEEIYQNLTGAESVHLADWPEYRAKFVDEKLNEQNHLVRTVVGLGHAVRDDAKIKVRQPLSLARMALPKGVDTNMVLEQQDVITDELNVKKLELIEDVEGIVKTVLKVNAKLLGPKYGKDVQEIIQLSKKGLFAQENGRVKLGKYVLDEGEFELGFESAEGVNAQNKDGITVILNTEITEDLMAEGFARDIVRAIQELRKEADYQVNDHVFVNIQAEDKKVDDAVTKFADYIARETLADEVQQSGDLEWDKEKIMEIDFKQVKISVKKV